jgi:cyclopropane fatty-acyl-phospholipid synthase-like methyltransferase
MHYIKALNYPDDYMRENIMGPNPLKLLEEIMTLHPLQEGMTVLDLGCGRGVTSVSLTKGYGLRVFAADLWIDPTDNKQRFDAMGLSSDQIVPLRAEAHELPFAQEFFDAVVSIDSYHYFGLDPAYLGKHLLPLVKRGGFLLIVVPSMKRDIHDDIPPEMLLSWPPEALDTIHDATYWRNVLSATDQAEIVHIGEMEGY